MAPFGQDSLAPFTRELVAYFSRIFHFVMKKYLKELNKRFGYRPTWEPGKPLKLGDIGVLEKGVFSNRTSLDDLGIPLELRVANTATDIKYASEGGVNIQSKLSGEAPLPEMTLSNLDA